MPDCPQCTHEIEEGARFCPRCGAALADLSGPTLTTPGPQPQRDSAASPHGRFEPGTRLGDRYRIVGLLGRGGMGEVYRADDLELGQSVALKFLPERVAADPLALDRFRSEVRTARQIAHPNVCRIYDIGQVDEHIFLTMEYIDGEDLSHVLRRMGRPSKEKAIEISRQLCFGLAAAHEAGILHRDLKPANIMIDGRGRVRITDFGLAGLIEDLEHRKEHGGTPAYMAPEQLERGEVSIRSDIYSLGLVLYEIFTGQRVHKAETVPELRDLHKTSSVTTPRSVVEEVDPAVERVILRCLEQSPSDRPNSVYGILAALPGGDPLAAALAAGETPSPELVANAGERGGLSGRVVGMLAAWIAGVALVAVMVSSAWHVPREPGVVLATRAKEMIREMGYEDLPENTAWGFEANWAYLEELLESGDTAWEGLDREWPPAVMFWCRWSPSPLLPKDFHQTVPTLIDPVQAEAGSMTVMLDGMGRLWSLDVEADPTLAPASPERREGYWQTLLDRAGVIDARIDTSEESIGQAQAAHSDEVRVWRVNAPEGSGEEFVAEAGSFRGRPVHFSIRMEGDSVGESEDGEEDQASVISFLTKAMSAAMLVWPVIMITAIVLAIRNVRAGRGDRGGALRAGLVMCVLYLVTEIANYRLGEQHISGALSEIVVGRSTGHALLHGFHMWIGYLALEPYVRKIWPQLLVAWVRLLSGRWRDPLVGREVLVGLALGMVIYLCGFVGVNALAGWLGYTQFPPVPSFHAAAIITSPAHQIYGLCHTMTTALIIVMYVLLLLLVFRLVMRRVWIAVLVAIALHGVTAAPWYFGVFSSPTSPLTAFSVGWGVVYTAVIALALLRFGLVCAFIAHVGLSLLVWMTGTTELRDWHSSPMLLMLAALGALVAYGAWASMQGRSAAEDGGGVGRLA